MPQRGGDAAGDAPRSAPQHPGHRHHRDPRDRRRIDRRHGERGAQLRRESHRAVPAPQGAGGRVHGRHRHGAEARRRLHRQYRRRQPVFGAGHSDAAPSRSSRATPTSSSAIATSRRSTAHARRRASACSGSAAGSCGRCPNTKVPDTTSGFRAYTRDAALRMTIVSEFSYTLESIIQAGKKRLAIAHVPVTTNPRTRESRLFKSVWTYLKASARHDRPHLRDVRAAQGVLVHRPHHLRHRRRHLSPISVLLRHRHGSRPPAVADPVGRAA